MIITVFKHYFIIFLSPTEGGEMNEKYLKGKWKNNSTEKLKTYLSKLSEKKKTKNLIPDGKRKKSCQKWEKTLNFHKDFLSSPGKRKKI